MNAIVIICQRPGATDVTEVAVESPSESPQRGTGDSVTAFFTDIQEYYKQISTLYCTHLSKKRNKLRVISSFRFVSRHSLTHSIELFIP
nr:hypothetical transcript [Hymenolepis microstoma]